MEEETLEEETLATLEEETQVEATSKLQLCQLTRCSFDVAGKGLRPFPATSLTYPQSVYDAENTLE
ncbi:hypothetical protein KSD_88130 [Ktedonobacter sp. SOSP1-85]|nr:hypothetical protein KSD_88130 [Ktedonobacter sp. SOSP1-85]